MEVSSAANPPAIVPEAVVRNELERLLATPSLRDSELLKQFLRYIVETTLAGEADQLKEYRVGVEVFGRDASFDPKLDPVVRMTARRLRAKLQEHYENGGRGALVRIEVPKGGYGACFVTVPQLAPAAISSSDRPGPLPVPESSAVARRRKAIFAVALVLLLAVGAATLYLRHWRFLQSQAQPPSLAILPFLNLTGNPDEEYLSDGITDEITGSLANAAGLRVVARTSAFKFKGKSQDVRDIGRQLNVSWILEGSIQTQGERLRTTAQLIRAADGYHIWSETYDREFKDTFAVEDEISHALAAALSTRFSADAESNAKAHQADPVAHDFYLRGQYMAQRLSWDDVKKAVNYFNQAIDHDPLYAEAYAALAHAYAVQATNAWVEPAEVYPKARSAAQRAVELEPNQPDAHAMLAHIAFFYDWDFPDAEREVKRAIELNPNSSRAHQWYGILLYYSRRFNEAREQFRLAKELNPLAVQIDMTVIMLDEAEHKYDAAIALDQKVMAEHDHSLLHALLGSLYADKKQYKDAIAEGQKAVALAGKDADMNLVLANLYAQAGQRDQALAIVHEVLAGKATFVPPFSAAGVYAQLGEKAEMYEWLDKGIEQHSPAMLKLNIAESFDAYRSEPRFQEILRKTGLLR